MSLATNFLNCFHRRFDAACTNRDAEVRSCWPNSAAWTQLMLQRLFSLMPRRTGARSTVPKGSRFIENGENSTWWWSASNSMEMATGGEVSPC